MKDEAGEQAFGSTSSFIPHPSSFQSLAFRKLLGRFIDVCNAIEYAHSRGVLHRDLKPGNIMLGKYGETLVVDWGLAKVKGRDDQTRVDDETTLRPTAASSSAPTAMGSVIGTPAYMPPEQAAGRLDQLGPASDVYSLGATLYYLLTGQAPFRKDDKAATLRRVQAGEFVPPRVVRPAVPKALEAICLRAMALRPPDRYASPAALADDVEQWLADEPVACYRELWPVRAGRWMRRRRTLVAGAAATVLVSLVSLASIAAVIGQSNRTLAAKNMDLEAANLRELKATELAQKNAHQAEENATRAEQNATIAGEQSQLALESLQSVIFDFQRKLKNVPGAGELRRAMLQTAVARLEEISDQFASRAAIDRNAVAALTALGDVFLQIGSLSPRPGTPERGAGSQEAGDEGQSADSDGPLTAATKVYQQAFAIAQKLAAADPTDALFQRDLSVSYTKLGDVSLRAGQVTEALGVLPKVAAKDPTDAQFQRDLTVSYNKLGDVSLQTGQVTEALVCYQKFLEISQKLAAADPTDAQAQRALSVSYNRLGKVGLQAGQVTDSLGYYQKGLEICQKLAAADPTDAQAQRDLWFSYDNLGKVSLQAGQVTDSLGYYQKGLEICQKRAAADPTDAQAQRDLWVSYYNHGKVSLQAGQVTAALGHYQKAMEIRQKLAAADPTDARAQRDLSISYGMLGNVSREAGQLGYYQMGLEIRQKLAAADPMDAQAQRDLSISYNRLGNVSRQAGQVTEALGHYQQGLEICQKLAAADPTDARAQFDLYVCHNNIATVQQKQKQYEQAIESYGRGLKVLQSLKEQKRLAPANEKWIGIAERAIQKCQHAPTALGDWKTLLEQPVDLLPMLLEFRGLQFAREGRTSDAAQAVAKLCELGTATAGQLYNAACVYSLCAVGIKAEKDEPTAEQAAKRQKHIADALATLREAIKAGYKNFAHMQMDPDLAPLRDLPELKALLPKTAL